MASKDLFYPDVSLQNFKMIEVMRRVYAEHPDYFENSPYPHEVEQYFKSWFQTPVVDAAAPANIGATAEALLGEDRHEALYTEVVKLAADLKAAKPSNADSSEAMSYFRTMTGLMDKLISHQERMLGIKAVHEFHTVVMEIMENTLTEEQRDDVMKRLKDAIKPK